MKKRMFSIFMSICIVFCLIPLVQVSASAGYVIDREMFRHMLTHSGSSLVVVSELEDGRVHTPLNAEGTVAYDVYTNNRGEDEFRVGPVERGGNVCLPENCEFLMDGANFRNVDLRGLNTSGVINMNHMFFRSRMRTINLSGWDTSNVTNMNSMFNWCDDLETLNIESFNTARVINMAGMFFGCRNLRMLDLRHFTTSSVENMRYIFGDCNNLQHLNLDSFDVHRVTDMEGAFYGCNHLETLSIPLWNLERVENMSNMFNFGVNGVRIHCTDNLWNDYCLNPEANGGFIPVHQL